MKRFLFLSGLASSICVGIQIFQLGNIYLIFCIAAYLSIISIGVCNLRSNIFIDCQPHRKLSGKIVLTIDDGPDINFTLPLLNLLRKYKLTATFFLIGKEAEKYPELVRKIDQEGHTIGSHGYSHSPWSNFYLCSQWEKEFHKTEKILGPYWKKKWFRPPFALASPHLAHAIKKCQYDIISFHVRALDFGNRRIHSLSDRLSKKISQGGVVMIHGAIPPATTESQKEKILDEFENFFQKISRCEVCTLEDYINEDNQKPQPKWWFKIF